MTLASFASRALLIAVWPILLHTDCRQRRKRRVELLAEKDVRVKTFPVIEIFGPTIQGEGAEAGLPCHFVRLGGCDYRCSWCDTMYAVDPAQVRRNSTALSAERIVDRLDALGGGPEWVILSGGNPALHALGPLVEALQGRGLKVAVETQGSIWRDWLSAVERLTISPKPPSSGMATRRHREQLEKFMARALSGDLDRLVLKVVCFDADDLAWAKETQPLGQIYVYISPLAPQCPRRAISAVRLRLAFAGFVSKSRPIPNSLALEFSRSST